MRTEVATLVYSGKLFHVCAAAMENIRSLRTDQQVNGTSSTVVSGAGSLPDKSVFQG